MSEWPSIEAIERERRRLSRRRRRVRTRTALAGTIAALALALTLVSALAVPLFRVSGDDMSPALKDGDVAAVLKGMPDGTGDICAFYAEGAVSFVRVIARAGSWVNVDGDGYVFVDGQVIDEPYASLSAAGDVAYPCQVPENMLFVLCDNRDAARDSRYADFGFVSEDAVIGRVIACFHPPF